MIEVGDVIEVDELIRVAEVIWSVGLLAVKTMITPLASALP